MTTQEEPRTGRGTPVARDEGRSRREDSIWTGERGRTTAGLFALAFLVAFESLAVITVMPAVARDLDGLAAYAVAFAAPLAVSVLARTVSAPWIDRAGPAPALGWGVAAFAAGLLVCGLAQDMTTFLVGRAVQGLGSGAVGVGLYVVVARAYPTHLRPRALAVMTSAWTVPAVAGPAVAGGLAHVLGWRAVFLGAPVLAVAVLAASWTAVRRLGPGPGRVADAARPPVLAATVASGAVLVVAVAGQRAVGWWPWLLAAGLGLLAVTVRPLVPRGTWSGSAGVPALVGARSLVASAYFAAEVYVPLALVDLHDVPVGLAGAALSGAAFTWFAGASLVARPERLGALGRTPLRRAVLGVAAVCVGISSVPLLLVPGVPAAVVVATWTVGGLGMGAAMTTFVTSVLERSVGREGASSASLQTADAVAESTALALGAAIFASVVVHGVGPAVLAAFVVPAACAAGGSLLLRRGFVR
jgi:MFS family permease